MKQLVFSVYSACIRRIFGVYKYTNMRAYICCVSVHVINHAPVVVGRNRKRVGGNGRTRSNSHLNSHSDLDTAVGVQRLDWSLLNQKS